MKTNCPHCQKSYNIDDSKIPVAQATIRCSSCSKNFVYVKGEGAQKQEEPAPVKPTPPPPATQPKPVVEEPSPESARSEESEFWQPTELKAPTNPSPAISEPPPSLSTPDEDPLGALDTSSEESSSLTPEFGSMEDLSADQPSGLESTIEQPELSAEGDGGFQLEPTSYAEESTNADGLVNQQPNNSLADDGGGNDYWDQMQALSEESPTVDQAPPAAGDSGASNDDDALLASLNQEKLKVKAETERLEGLNTRMSAGAGVPVPTPPPPTPPKPVANNKKEEVPEPAVEPLDLTNEVEAIPSSPPPPPTTTPAAKAPPSPPTPKKPTNAKAPPPPKPPSSPSPKVTTKPGVRVTDSGVHRVTTGQYESPKRRFNKRPLIFGGAALLGLVIVAAAYPMVKRLLKPEVEPVFRSETMASLRKKAEEKSVKPLDLESKVKPTKDKKGGSAAAEEESRSAYEVGIEAYQRHDMQGYREAERALLKAYKEEDRSLRTIVALSELYSVLGDALDRKELIERAFKMAQAVVAKQKDLAIGHRALSHAYYYSAQYDKSFEHAQKALALDDKDKQAYLVRGLAMWSLGKGGGGLQQAVKKDAGAFRPIHELTRYYLETEKYRSAAVTSRKMTKLFPARFEGYKHAMQAYMASRQYKKAAAYADQALALNEEDLELHIDAAKAQLELGQNKKSSDILELYIAKQDKLLRRDLSRIYIVLGKANLKLDPKKAAFYFGQVVSWDKGNVTAQNYLGLSYFEQKAYKKSLNHFRTALSINPNEKQIKLNLALAYFHANYLQQSEKLLSEVIQGQPRNIQAHFYLASIYEKRGQRHRAIAGLEKLLSIDPRHRVARAKVRQLKSGL